MLQEIRGRDSVGEINVRRGQSAGPQDANHLVIAVVIGDGGDVIDRVGDDARLVIGIIVAVGNEQFVGGAAQIDRVRSVARVSDIAGSGVNVGADRGIGADNSGRFAPGVGAIQVNKLRRRVGEDAGYQGRSGIGPFVAIVSRDLARIIIPDSLAVGDAVGAGHAQQRHGVPGDELRGRALIKPVFHAGKVIVVRGQVVEIRRRICAEVRRQRSVLLATPIEAVPGVDCARLKRIAKWR